MFFRPTPSKLDQAKQAARDAASAVSGAAGSVADSAHSFLEHAPKIAANVGEAVAAKASGVGGVVAAKAANVGESLSGARDIVAAKVDAVRHRAASEAEDSVEAAQLKAAATRKAAEIAAKEAERATRDAQKKAEAEIARAERELAHKRAEFERSRTFIEERTEKLDEARLSAQQQADEIHARRKARVEVEAPAPVQSEVPIAVEVPTLKEIPVPAHAPTTVEIHEDDDDFEYQVVAEKEGGSKLWLIIGGAVFVGATLVYFFAPGSGRRSRAAIKDRLAQVKDQAVDKVTGAADAAATTGTELKEHVDTLVEAADNAGEVHAPPQTHAVETYEDVVPTSTDPLSDEVDMASSNAVEGAEVEAYEPLGHIETAANAALELDEPHHPNIFDKVAGVVGNVAGVAEHLAGDDKNKDGAKETAQEIEAAAEAAKHETKEEREASSKRKKNK